MERWVLATLFASGSEPRDVYINVLFVTKMERVGDHTEVEFSSGTKISVMELPHSKLYVFDVARARGSSNCWIGERNGAALPRCATHHPLVGPGRCRAF